MVKSRVIFIIVAMVLLLFLQIEAANAGLLSRWRQFLEESLSPTWVVSSGIFIMVFALVYFAVFDKSLNIHDSQEPKP